MYNVYAVGIYINTGKWGLVQNGIVFVCQPAAATVSI